MSGRLRGVFLTAIFIAFFPIAVFSQTGGVTDSSPLNLEFERLSVEHGLSGSLVGSILQDRKGFMWFGTFNGLNRYDGHKFTIYKHNPNDLMSLSDDNIICLYEDPQGILWVGTWLGGLNRFDPLTETFRHYRHDPDNSRSLSHDDIRSIQEFPKGSGKLWIGTRGGGVNYFDPQSDTFKHFRHDPQNPRSLNGDEVFDCYEDQEGVMWVATTNGLGRFEQASETFRRYKVGVAFRIYEDHRNVIWVGTARGLVRFDRDTETIKHYQPDPQNPGSSSNVITAIAGGKSDNLWVGTQEALYLFDRENGIFQHLKHDPANSGSMSVLPILMIYDDHAGAMWVGTDGGGVLRLKQSSTVFEHFKHDPANPRSLTGNRLDAIYADRSGMIWVGARSAGLDRFDRKRGIFQHFQPDPGKSSSRGLDAVISIREAHEGSVWIGSLGYGLNRFDPKRGTFQHFIPDARKPGSLSGNIILSLYEDSKDILWIGTWQRGLNRFDRESQTFRHYRHDPQNPQSLSDNDVSCIYEAPSEPGVLWIGTYKGGLNRFDPEREIFQRYQHDSQNLQSLSSNMIYTVHEDREGILWIGTHRGLNGFDRETQSFIRYGAAEGLSSETILGILEDDRGDLWISTNNGIFRFNLEDRSFKSYDARDGLQSNEFAQNAYCKLRSGEMVFGGMNGFNIFHPDSVKDNPYIPPVFITGLKRYRSEGNESTAKEERGISEKEAVEFSYQENIFSVEFAALNFRIPEKNQYAYKLEGFNDNWIHLGTKHDVTFTNLDPGEYTLRVKGSNNDGVWNEEGASLRITIHPPWWKTWRAYSLYALLALGLLYGIRRSELNRQRLRHEAEMEHLEASKLQEMDRLKSRFFANISHEFRTPLTLILGPLEKLTSRVVDRESRQDLSMMQRNAKRLLQLINQLLDLSKLEAGGMKLQAAPENIVPLLRGLTNSFESLAKQKGIDLHFHASAEEIIAYVEREKIEKIFVNLLSNAFKFTSDGGAVSVTLDTPLNLHLKRDLNESPFEGGHRGMLQITVSDTGSGIAAEHLDKIFDRFYQVADSSNGDSKFTRETSGTGIGLALTKELVELHRGAISVTSEPGKGTEFVIRLPLGKEHLQEDEIVGTGNQQIADSPFRKLDEERAITIVDQSAESVEQASDRQRLEKSTTVLIVEDNPDMRSYMRGHLETDHRIIEAENGADGLKQAQKFTPALIISDVMMPEMDGFQLCDKLKNDARTSHIPVILLTAKASGESKIEGLETGADDYLTKPFDAKELRVRVQNLIAQRRRLKERFHRDLKVQPKDITVTSMDEALLQNVIRVVEENMANDDFDTATLARQAGLSRGHLNRKLRALTNCSSREFIRTLRLKRAAQLLEQGFGNVTEVAYEVGFNSLAHFAKVFREQFGVAPKAYISRLKKRQSLPRS